MADWDKFDYAFVCPTGVDQDLAVGYEKVLVEYRQQCAGLDMSPSAVLRVALIVSQQVRHQNTSRRAYGCGDGYANPAMEKNAVKAWSDLAREHDDYVDKARARHSASGNLVPAEAVNEAVLAVLGRVSDARLRAQLQDQIATEFEKAGI